MTASRIGRAARALMPTLDDGVLANPATGCLRPPLSPHRDGSRSELVAGTLTTLLEPSTSVDDATALLDALRAATPAPAPVPSAANTVTARPAPLRVDAIARRLGAAGTIERRAARYRLEREVWAWWLAELDWMTTRGRAKSARRSTSPVLWSEKPGDHYPAMPRTAGRIRFDLARAQAAAGLLTARALEPTHRRAAA